MKLIAKIKDFFSFNDAPDRGYHFENLKATVFSNYHNLGSKIKSSEDHLKNMIYEQNIAINSLNHSMKNMEEKIKKLSKPKPKKKPKELL